MKFSTGFIAGAVVGGYIAANMTQHQRSRVTSAASTIAGKVRDSTIAGAVGDNLTDVVDAASQRVSGVVDTAGTSVADAVAPNGSNSTTV